MKLYFSGLENPVNYQIAKNLQVPLIFPYGNKDTPPKDCILDPNPYFQSKNKNIDDFFTEYCNYVIDNGIEQYLEINTKKLDILTVLNLRVKFQEKNLNPILLINRSELDYQDTTFRQVSGLNRVSLALDGKLSPEWMIDWFSRNLRELRERKVLILGYNINKVNEIKDLPFYAISQAYWNKGSKFGVTFIYDYNNQKIKVYDKSKKESVREQILNNLHKYDLDTGLFQADDEITVNTWNAYQWIEYGKQLEKKYNGYWLDRNPLPVIVKKNDLEFTGYGRNDLALSICKSCNICQIMDSCPYFEKDSVCKLANTQPLKTPKELTEAALNVIALNYRRLIEGIAKESIEGRFLSEEVSEFSRSLLEMMAILKTLGIAGDSFEIKASGQPAGMLSQIFGGLMGGGAGTTRKESSSVNEVALAGKQAEIAEEFNKKEEDVIDGEFKVHEK